MKMAGSARPAYFFYQAAWNIVDWIFPPTCPGCGQMGERWCKHCQQQIQPICDPICSRCGEPQEIALPAGVLCAKCQAHLPEYEALRSYAAFGGTIRAALHCLKYKRDIGIGESLSKHLIELYNDLKWKIDYVVPVPLSSKRFRERGYNQSSFLAQPLAYAINKPYRPDLLQRTRDTRSQVDLSAHERLQNVTGAFEARSKYVQGKAVLVIDDVTTTGSTLGACASALNQAGASAVFGLTLARAVRASGQPAEPQPTIFNVRGGTNGS